MNSMTAILIVLSLSVAAGDDARDKPATPEEQYKALVKEFYQAANLSFNATTDEERAKQVARAITLAPRLLELAEKHRHEAFVMDALIQVVSQELWLQANTRHPGRGNDGTEARALELLLRDHVRSDKLGEACRRAQYGFGKQCETFLRTVMEKSPHRDVQALACLRLAQFLDGRLKRLDLVKEQPDMAKRYEGLSAKTTSTAGQPATVTRCPRPTGRRRRGPGCRGRCYLRRGRRHCKRRPCCDGDERRPHRPHLERLVQRGHDRTVASAQFR